MALRTDQDVAGLYIRVSDAEAVQVRERVTDAFDDVQRLHPRHWSSSPVVEDRGERLTFQPCHAHEGVRAILVGAPHPRQVRVFQSLRDRGFTPQR